MTRECLTNNHLRAVFGGVLLFTLTGCAGRPEGVLSPVAMAAPDASTVEMLVATTRQASSQPGVMFSGERGKLSFADITVSIPPDAVRTIGEVQWPKYLPGNPETDFVALKAQDLGLPQAIAMARKSVAVIPQHRALVFVHGFNNKFEDAVFRFAQIIHDSRAPVLPILFTWPSRGNVLAYGYDHESANYSRDALESVLQALAKDPQIGDISILAHSMGNWVTLEALRQMAIRNGSVSAKIKTIMLAAPDVDVDVFKQQMAEIGPHNANLTLFVSQDDRALEVSSKLWGAPRLGAVDPEADPNRSQLAADNITVVDLTKLKTGGGLNHNKFATSPEIVALIGQRLVEGQTITDSYVGVSDRIIEATTGAASTFGSAAGLVLSAPAMVVDPDSRSGYGDKLQTFGSSLATTAQSATRILPTTGSAYAALDGPPTLNTKRIMTTPDSGSDGSEHPAPVRERAGKG